MNRLDRMLSICQQEGAGRIHAFLEWGWMLGCSIMLRDRMHSLGRPISGMATGGWGDVGSRSKGRCCCTERWPVPFRSDWEKRLDKKWCWLRIWDDAEGALWSHGYETERSWKKKILPSCSYARYYLVVGSRVKDVPAKRRHDEEICRQRKSNCCEMQHQSVGLIPDRPVQLSWS